jgi:hypothetical protein
MPACGHRCALAHLRHAVVHVHKPVIAVAISRLLLATRRCLQLHLPRLRALPRLLRRPPPRREVAPRGPPSLGRLHTCRRRCADAPPALSSAPRPLPATPPGGTPSPAGIVPAAAGGGGGGQHSPRRVPAARRVAWPRCAACRRVAACPRPATDGSLNGARWLPTPLTGAGQRRARRNIEGAVCLTLPAQLPARAPPPGHGLDATCRGRFRAVAPLGAIRRTGARLPR